MAVTAQGSGDAAVELFHLLDPIDPTRTPADVERYMAEPCNPASWPECSIVRRAPRQRGSQLGRTRRG
jgi:hypothetical protein